MMTDHETFLPTSPDDAIVYLRSAAAALADADRARAKAAGRVREAVMAARVMKVSWESIGKELGVSRQAAAERYGGEVRAQLVLAWHGIEILLAQIAADRGMRDRPVDILEKLGREGAIPAGIANRALQLYKSRSAAVHGVGPEVSVTDAERLTDVAIPLVGMLWFLRHADDVNGNEAAY
jgi:hypothetical protein